jgi:hypothetical protein
MANRKIYSYIVAEDYGFAPNPFGAACTLACCKPKIRQAAVTGDWILGFTPKPYEGRLVYAMEVNKTSLFGMYFNDPEFQDKKPNPDNIYGDNIYQEVGKGPYKQIDNFFHDRDCVETDLSSSSVLISYNFYYFGKEAPEVPEECKHLIHQIQGHKAFDFDTDGVEAFFKWLEGFPKGINGQPRDQRPEAA